MSGMRVLLSISIDRKAYKFVMSQRLAGLKHKDPTKLTHRMFTFLLSMRLSCLDLRENMTLLCFVAFS